jgi:predicted double-glycine peptidase
MVEICLTASVNETYKNFLIPYNIGGILVAKNLNLEKTKQKDLSNQLQLNNETIDMDEQKDSSIEIAPDSVLSLKESYQGKDASLEFLSLQSDMSVVRNEVDWLIKNSLSDAGLDLNSIVIERGYTSGFGIVAESQGLMEIRKSHIHVLSKFEQDLFEVIKVLLNFEEDIAEYYPEDATLSVDYMEPVFPRTIEETQKEREMKLKQNTISYLDLIKEDNIDITDNETARQKLEENYRINKEFESIFGISGSSVFGNNADADDNETASIDNNSEPEEPIKYAKEFDNAGPKGRGKDDTQNEDVIAGLTHNPIATGTELDLPNDRQFSYWDCGDAVVVTALARFGIEPNPESLIDELGSTQDWGTEPESIKQVLEDYGLTVELKEMTIDNIKNYINKEIPIILDIQAWHFEDGREYDYNDEWNDGHYVTAYGYTETGIKLKDPSSLANRELSWEELESRWHDVDREGNKLYNIGIAYYGLPVKYSSDKTEVLG